MNCRIFGHVISQLHIIKFKCIFLLHMCRSSALSGKIANRMSDSWSAPPKTPGYEISTESIQFKRIFLLCLRRRYTASQNFVNLMTDSWSAPQKPTSTILQEDPFIFEFWPSFRRLGPLCTLVMYEWQNWNVRDILSWTVNGCISLSSISFTAFFIFLETILISRSSVRYCSL